MERYVPVLGPPRHGKSYFINLAQETYEASELDDAFQEHRLGFFPHGGVNLVDTVGTRQDEALALLSVLDRPLLLCFVISFANDRIPRLVNQVRRACDRLHPRRVCLVLNDLSRAMMLHCQHNPNQVLRELGLQGPETVFLRVPQRVIGRPTIEEVWQFLRAVPPLDALEFLPDPAPEPAPGILTWEDAVVRNVVDVSFEISDDAALPVGDLNFPLLLNFGLTIVEFPENDKAFLRMSRWARMRRLHKDWTNANQGFEAWVLPPMPVQLNFDGQYTRVVFHRDEHRFAAPWHVLLNRAADTVSLRPRGQGEEGNYRVIRRKGKMLICNAVHNAQQIRMIASLTAAHIVVSVYWSS